MVNETARLTADGIANEEVFFRPLAGIGGYRLASADKIVFIVINDGISRSRQEAALKMLRQSTETFELLYANELGC